MYLSDPVNMDKLREFRLVDTTGMVSSQYGV